MLRCSCLCCIWVSLVWGMFGASLHTIIISVRIQNEYFVVNISTLISYLHNYTIMLEFVRVACKHNIKFRIILKWLHFFELILFFLPCRPIQIDLFTLLQLRMSMGCLCLCFLGNSPRIELCGRWDWWVLAREIQIVAEVISRKDNLCIETTRPLQGHSGADRSEEWTDDGRMQDINVYILP